MIFADFECKLKSKDDDDDVTTGIINEKRNEKLYQQQEAASYWYNIVCIDPDFHMPERRYTLENMLPKTC